MKLHRRQALSLAPLLLAAAALPRTANAAGIFSEFGVAIRGADPVAFFTEGRPVEGNSSFPLTWSGAKWHFASAANRDRFEADPLLYAPQFGGWCAWAMTKSMLAPIDPTAWVIVDDKLYLNFNHRTLERFNRDPAGNIAKANAAWDAEYA
ncbi:MAG: YHS domain-containing (seleno)protein [Pseudomonadota bacterium]